MPWVGVMGIVSIVTAAIVERVKVVKKRKVR